VRRSPAILLILALLTACAVPAQAHWVCPDGRACVAGMPCAEMDLGSPPRVKPAPSASDCCGRERTVGSPVYGRLHTRHGCRLAVSPRPSLRCVTQSDLPVLQPATLPAAIELSSPALRSVVIRGERYEDFSPPPLRKAGPSRAPPRA
jgi:hypothetical protein